MPQNESDFWTLDEAIELVTKINRFCPLADCHVALTGGTLYKKGRRKDVDIMFYRIRQKPHIDIGLLATLLKENLGIKITDEYGWLWKATYKNKGIDIMFPESSSNGPYVKVHPVKEDAVKELNQTAQNSVDDLIIL